MAIYNPLGYVYFRDGQKDNAIKYMTMAIDMESSVYGENDEMVSDHIRDLAVAYKQMGNYDEALVFYRRHQTIELQAKPIRWHVIVACNTGIARTLMYNHCYNGAIRLLNETIEIEKTHMKPRNLQIENTLRNFRKEVIELRAKGKGSKDLQFQPCSHCLQEFILSDLLQCPNCASVPKVLYCSKTCQVASWKTHKLVCKGTGKGKGKDKG
jgi:tetratricopeptide (TPR) repeat protein